MARELPTRYDPAAAEPPILRAWLDSGLFHPEPGGSPEENYSIAIPPPNVTGALHMGHALNGTVQDTLIRYHRMRGERTKWILGTDHAGIATQTQVERLLVSEGTSREEVGREEFTRRVWDWRATYGGTIVEQYKRLGASCDYETERFTFDDDYAAAVTRVFVALFDKGLIYRDNYLVNWDPGSRSAISDLEVHEVEVTDTLYRIAYPLADGVGRGRRGHRPPGDDARGHGGRREPRRSPLRAPGRPPGDPPARRAPPRDHRRRLREDGFWERCPQDHARARSQRLRDRPRVTGSSGSR